MHVEARATALEENTLMQLEIETVHEHGRAVVTPRGEIDLVTQLQLKQHINDLVVEGNVHIVVDLNETTFLDSTGLGALIGARRQTHAFKGSFAVVCIHERILKLFRITGIEKFIPIYESREVLFASEADNTDTGELPEVQLT
jgi:anti-sigma B factor antagonist